MTQSTCMPSLKIWLVLTVTLMGQYPSDGAAEDYSPRRLLREASIYAARIDDDNLRQQVLDGVVRSQRQAGDAIGAMSTAKLEAWPFSKDNAWAVVVDAQARSGDIPAATQTLGRIRENIARANAMAPIALAYAEAGNVPKALEIARDIPDTSYAHGDAFLRIAALQAKTGDVSGALRTVRDTWGLNPYGLIPIVDAQLASGTIEEATQLTALTDDLYLKSYLLWALVSQITDSSRKSAIAATIPVEGVRALTYKDMAMERLAAGDVQGCLENLRVATASAPAMRNIYAKADVQWRIATLFAQAKNYDSAKTVAVSIALDGHRDNALRDIISIQAAARDYDDAIKTASLGTDEANLVDYARGRVAEQQVLNEPLEKVATTLRMISDGEAKDVALRLAAEAAGEAGRITSAIGLIQLQRERVAEALKFSELPNRGMLDERALKLSRDAHGFQRAVSGAFDKIAVWLASQGATQEAMGYALVMPDKTESAETIGRLAFMQATAGDVDGAMRWIIAARVPSHKAFALSAVANALLVRDSEKVPARNVK